MVLKNRFTSYDKGEGNMKKPFRKITHMFKNDTDVLIGELNEYSRSLDKAIKLSERNIQILKSALREHTSLQQHMAEKQKCKRLRIESINKVVIPYIKAGKDDAARELISEKVKEQKKLQGLNEIIDQQNQRILEYQYRLKKAMYTLDHQKSKRESFVIKQQIAVQELMILKKLDKLNSKKHIERIQKEILNADLDKALDQKEDIPIDSLIDGEIEKELALFKVRQSANGL